MHSIEGVFGLAAKKSALPLQKPFDEEEGLCSVVANEKRLGDQL